MATLEKPKSKKHKKKVLEEIKTEDEQTLDSEYYSTSGAACSKLVSYECAVSKEFQPVLKEEPEQEVNDIPSSAQTFYNFDVVENKNDNKAFDEQATSKSLKDELFEGEIEETQNDFEEDEMFVEPWTSRFEPSAPETDFKVTTYVQPEPEPVAQYPSLSSLRLTEENTHPAGTNSRFVTKPKAFTAEQMKEIYYCKELDHVRQFETYFIQHNLHFSYQTEPLFLLIQAYSLLRGKLKMNLIDLKKMQEKFLKSSDKIWQSKEITEKFEALCADNVVMQISESFEVKEVDSRKLESTSRTLSQIYDLLSFTYTTNLVKCTTLKFQIEDMIRKIVANSVFSLFNNSTQIKITSTVDPDIQVHINHLRMSISILFLFIRKPSPDKEFQQHVKAWLNKLIALQLRLGTKEDHWFILFHLLRCPSGVGAWARTFVQLPKPSSDNSDELSFVDIPEINHIISVLSILLLPIKERSEFLKAFWQSNKDCDAVREELWVLVDSEGEEDGSEDAPSLKESDLIALLDQIPFKMFFGTVLNVVDFPGEISIDNDLITGTSVLKVIAFSSTLIDLFGDGMLTYNVERYKQFAKRLGRLIRHVLQYVSDYHDLFIANGSPKNQNVCERIKVELNELFIKACSYIYRTKNLATWQYFSSLPFATLDVSMVWQLFYFLNVGFPTQFPVNSLEDYENEFNSPNFWDRFNDAITDSSDEDLYYLLQAFFEIANERSKTKDWDLIKLVCQHIFYIGFINERTRDICYKTSRDLLVNLTLAYNDLMTNLMMLLKYKFDSIENAIYLFKALPLENWKPQTETFDILSNWLLNFHYESKENILARIIISHLNWGFDYDGKLFLPHNIHLRMACLVSDALTAHSPEVIGSSGISESVRQVSNLIDNQSSKDQFVSWCWYMISLLRLHSMDQNKDLIRKFLDNPAEPLIFIPDINKIDSIYQGVTESRPLAVYISILVSLWGHSVPLICHKGFENMKLLIQDYRHCVVIRAVQLIVPLFLECPDSLVKSENFHQVLNLLISADCTYLKMAKDLLYTTSIGPVMELLNNMIHCQVLGYMELSLTSPMLLVDLWLQILTSINGWHNSNVVYFINNLLSISYQFPDSWYKSKMFFKSYYKNCEDWKVNKTSTFKLLLGSNNNTRLPIFSHLTSWLSLLLLEVEFETKELQVWPELLRQLSKTETKGSLDNILKKTTQTVGVPNYNPQFLVIFKFANLISTMEPSNSLFPLMCQKFFKLYLARVPLHYDEERFSHTYGVSDKFYEYNVSLMKKIKSKISSAEKHYQEEAEKVTNDEGYKYFLLNCSKMMKTYLLWLEETNLNKITKNQNIDLPPQYNPVKLADIFSDDGQHWTEFIHLPTIREKQRSFSESWKKKSFRNQVENQRLREPLQAKPRSSPTKRIFSHLQSYDKSEGPPDLIKEEPLLPSPVTSFKNVPSTLKSHLKSLGADSHKFTLLTCEMNSLNGNYRDLIQSVYDNMAFVIKKNKLCNKKPMCTGAAAFEMHVTQPKLNTNVQRKVEQNRERYDLLVKEMLSRDYGSLVLTLESLEIIVKSLMSKNADSTETTDIAISFFYEVIKKLNDDIQNFAPTSETCNTILSELGSFVQNNQETEGLKILELALQRPELLKILSSIFVPTKTSPNNFIKMYKFIVDSHMKRCDTKVLFVLLSKFDLPTWLQNTRPKLSDISILLKLIMSGLENWNHVETSLLQDLFRRHLTHIFEFDFPEHYGEVLQIVLSGISDQKLMSIVIVDLLNALTSRFGCEPFTLEMSNDKIVEISVDFANKQNLFNYKASVETISMFTRHFQGERLQHGLNGLYPKHKNYCEALSIWFTCFGHVTVFTALCAYPGVLADQISDSIFGCIVDMYSPWLITYTESQLQGQTANWIKELIHNGKVLYPWTANHAPHAKIMCLSFINCIKYVLDSLPVSNTIMGHVFSWYTHNFAMSFDGHIYNVVHESLFRLPWARFYPQTVHLNSFQNCLQLHLPINHKFLGQLFLRVPWHDWMLTHFMSWTIQTQCQMMSQLLAIYVQISFEPHLHNNIQLSKILEDSMGFPWFQVQFQGLEGIMNWMVKTVDPTIVLRLPQESNYADRAVLDLLKISSGMIYSSTKEFTNSHQLQAKRICYTRSIVKLLRLCASKNTRLIETKEGLSAMKSAIYELLDTIETIAQKSSGSRDEVEKEVQNLMMEICGSIQTQSEQTSRIFVDAMVIWQSKSQIGSFVLSRTLSSFSLCNVLISGVYNLFEATIHNYFRHTGESLRFYTPKWSFILNSLQPITDKLDFLTLVKGQYLLTLHAYILCKINTFKSVGEKITFIDDILQLLDNLKIEQIMESKLILVYGVIIAACCQILIESENVQKTLLRMARYFQVQAQQVESWGEGLLGAIGLKKDAVSNKRRLLMRSFSCLIFALFPDKSKSEPVSNQEFVHYLSDLKTLWNNKKYSDVQTDLTRCIGIINANFFVTPYDAPSKVLELIQILYSNNFMFSVEEVWKVSNSNIS